mmetsp:Transcript_48614/g.150099  ORF Transcript_48614/g.150099 Transcript_48614/m.150099 type:complete len:243 (-) Transcript_48614:413-1141(-)
MASGQQCARPAHGSTHQRPRTCNSRPCWGQARTLPVERTGKAMLGAGARVTRTDRDQRTVGRSVGCQSRRTLQTHVATRFAPFEGCAGVAAAAAGFCESSSGAARRHRGARGAQETLTHPTPADQAGFRFASPTLAALLESCLFSRARRPVVHATGSRESLRAMPRAQAPAGCRHPQGRGANHRRSRAACADAADTPSPRGDADWASTAGRKCARGCFAAVWRPRRRFVPWPAFREKPRRQS